MDEPSLLVVPPCNHISCPDCFVSHLHLQITSQNYKFDRKSGQFAISCFVPKCKFLINDINMIRLAGSRGELEEMPIMILYINLKRVI